MSKAKKTKFRGLTDGLIIGWREWVELPELGIKSIKAKVDTGARSSSLHVVGLQTFGKDGQPWVRFKVHPQQRHTRDVIESEAQVLEYRSIRSSSGKASIRPVILTSIQLFGKIWKIELTLANRDEMGFRMLLGRESFRNRFVVDAGHSYYAGRPPKKKPANRSKEGNP